MLLSMLLLQIVIVLLLSALLWKAAPMAREVERTKALRRLGAVVKAGGAQAVQARLAHRRGQTSAD